MHEYDPGKDCMRQICKERKCKREVQSKSLDADNNLSSGKVSLLLNNILHVSNVIHDITLSKFMSFFL